MPRGRSPLPCREAGALYLCREAGVLEAGALYLCREAGALDSAVRQEPSTMP